MIKTIFWKNNTVVMIDQNALPLIERQVICADYRQVIAAIQNMTVRGAPAIGVAAAMGAALGARKLAREPSAKVQKKFHGICDEIAAARPTARNLFWALERMKQCLEEAMLAGKQNLSAELVKEARRICAEDISVNQQLGRVGRVLFADGDHVLTHCNAGALATAGYGTALGVVRAACAQGKRLHIYADETRPMLQGARLTAWEMQKEKIPVTLITDSMAGFLMRQGSIDKIIVGADRIALNGDVANKIGTYSLAVLARVHRIPFYIAAPLSTFDFSVKTGADIPIEERQDSEVSGFGGVRTAPLGIRVYNPAFDVTPAGFITAMITEKGILRRPYRQSIACLRKGVALK